MRQPDDDTTAANLDEVLAVYAPLELARRVPDDNPVAELERIVSRFGEVFPDAQGAQAQLCHRTILVALRLYEQGLSTAKDRHELGQLAKEASASWAAESEQARPLVGRAAENRAESQRQDEALVLRFSTLLAKCDGAGKPLHNQKTAGVALGIGVQRRKRIAKTAKEKGLLPGRKRKTG